MRETLATLRARAQARIGFHRTAFRSGGSTDVVFPQGIAHTKDHQNGTIHKANNAND